MARSAPLLILVAALAVVPAVACAAGLGGMREIKSKHLTLYTDLAPDSEVDALGELFDQAFTQWCAYFDVDTAQHADWHVGGCLIRARERFEAAGLLPPDVPQFENGYSRGDRFWMNDQTSAYYRRHLLLHEGTHCFMNALAGGTGPPWYSEGIAELLATHRLVDGQLELKYFPRSPGEASKWGRVEIVRSAYAAGRAKTLGGITKYGGTLHSGVEPYGWCWAAAAFLDGHPRYGERFRQLRRRVDQPEFNAYFAEAFHDDRARLNEDWQLFVANIDYGFDFPRMDVEPAAGKPIAGKSATAQVAADRGWQSSGIALEPGRKYRLQATGRYVVADDGKPWVSGPGGVTIRYHQGRPLGMLLAAVRTDGPLASGASGLVKPIAVGREKTLSVKQPGTLYLRINDSAGQLEDNSGTAVVQVTAD